MANPLRWLRVAYYEWRLREALRDEEYWADEQERVALNRGVARARIEIARRKLHDARYPVNGVRRSQWSGT